MIRHRVLFVACALLCGPGAVAQGDLQQDLAALESLRNGRETDYGPVEQMGQELLGKYTTPEEQGQVYVCLAHIYGQSGLLKPERGIALAEEALKRPISANDRMTMLVTIGDSYIGGKWDDRGSFPERRRKGVASFLIGLNEVLKMKLPAARPAHQPRPPDDHEDQTAAGRARYAATLAAWEKSQTLRQLIFQREVLTREVATPYLVKPYATEELRAELARLLEDKAVARQILTVVEATIPGSPKVLPTANPAGRAWSFWLVMIGGMIVVLALAAYGARRRFATR